MDHVMRLGRMEAHKPKKGMAYSKNNYRHSSFFQNRNCYGCGKLGHFVRDCPTKKKKNSAQCKPMNQQKNYANQQSVPGKWTETERKFSASNLQEGFSSGPSGFCEDYSSSASDFSEDYSSSASDSLEIYSFSVSDPFEDYLSSASESSSSSLDSSEVYSSLVSDLSNFSSSSASDSDIVYTSSDTDKSEDKDLNEFEECEEIQPRQRLAQKASDDCLQFPMGTGVDSQNIRQVSKEHLDSAECHKVVQTMHNLSVLLLINSKPSDNLSESDLQALQSVICNLSQCLVKRTGVSQSTDVFAFTPEKQLVAANSEKTEQDCYAAEEKEDPVGKRSFNIEGELNLIKSEIRCLRMELEMENLKKSHSGAHENGNSETLANRSDVINGSCAEVNLVIKENDFDYTSAPVSHEGSDGLPDLKLNPIMGGVFTVANYNGGSVNPQYNINGEPIFKSSLSTTDHNPGQPNAETETKQIEGQFRVLQEPRSCSEFDIVDQSGTNEENDSDLEDKSIKSFENHTEVKKLNENPEDNSEENDSDLEDKSIKSFESHTGVKELNENPEDNSEENDSDLEDKSIKSFENHTEVKKLNENPEDNSDFIYIRDYTGNTLLEDGAMTESPIIIRSATFFHELEDVDVMHTLEESSCSESDSSWEQINSDNEDYI